MRWTGFRAELRALGNGLAADVLFVLVMALPILTVAAQELIFAPTGMNPLSEEPESWQFMADADESCVGCHRMSRELSHATGVSVPPGDSPTAPLDTQGRMRCQTCHLFRNEDGMHRASTNRPYLLRQWPVQDLCRSCHRVDRDRDRRAVHGAWFSRAHLDQSIPSAPSRSGLLDRETNQCLSCHDGVIQSSCDVRGPGGPAIGYSHPVGNRYDRPSRRASRLYPSSYLSKSLRLFDGRLGCGSCHNPYGRLRFLLSMDNDRSRLCLACHDM